jgi:predicted RNA binding protein YcfA (HicA-like mRNA interferase family)
VTWGEVIRALQKAGFKEDRTGKGSHRRFVHADGRFVWVTVHRSRESGALGYRILKDAGIT